MGLSGLPPRAARIKRMDSPLSPQARRALRARAHPLKPVVMISGQGLSLGVVAEIERGLLSHGLIKIRVTGHGREERDELLAQVCAKTQSSAVQHIGRILVIYREIPGAGSGVFARPPAPGKKTRISGFSRRKPEVRSSGTRRR